MRVEIKTSHGATRSARFGVKRWTIERDLNNRDDVLQGEEDEIFPTRTTTTTKGEGGGRFCFVFF